MVPTFTALAIERITNHCIVLTGNTLKQIFTKLERDNCQKLISLKFMAALIITTILLCQFTLFPQGPLVKLIEIQQLNFCCCISPLMEALPPVHPPDVPGIDKPPIWQWSLLSIRQRGSISENDTQMYFS